MEVFTAATTEDVSNQAAGFVATAARSAIEVRGQFCLALSGGSTPWKMLNHLVSLELPWQQVHIFQVDERVAPDGDSARNFTHIQAQLLNRIDIPAENVHPMPVTHGNLEKATQSYCSELESMAGHPPVLDLVHLGMGGDGHTASLLPGDDALNEHESDVAMTGEYQGHLRMTLTFPLINRARQILWLVMGEDKVEMMTRMMRADATIPAGRISHDQAAVFTDIQGLASNELI
jgi:6-phosphogluconolactonase